MRRIVSLLIILVVSYIHPPITAFAASCEGPGHCDVCKNCRYCGHCNSGGTCSVCTGGGSSRSSGTTDYSDTSDYSSDDSDSYDDYSPPQLPDASWTPAPRPRTTHPNYNNTAEVLFDGKVVAVTDGDTLQVLHNGRAEKIRLNGVDAPESGQPFGTTAKRFTAKKAFGQIVTVLIKDKDRYGRKVADVRLPDGSNLNQQLVSEGLAWWYRQYAPSDQTLRQLETEAKGASRGLWKDCCAVAPWEWRRGKRASRTSTSQPQRKIIPPATPTVRPASTTTETAPTMPHTEKSASKRAAQKPVLLGIMSLSGLIGLGLIALAFRRRA